MTKALYRDYYWPMIKECPDFLYRYNPSKKSGDTRYVFKDKTFSGRDAYVNAYWHAYELKFHHLSHNEPKRRY